MLIILVVNKKECKCISTKNGVATLMHFTQGARLENGTPSFVTKNAPRQRRVHS
ncbi:hypothetical protein SAMN04488494_2730 [Xylanibacter ruminicola]|uniref:Uncharacterized protein n=1 Tax=Xylanibacter ruminicola TaxID=839 RepID=A0A1M7M1W5_XYLRU|nr:hypothetical protein SAMN04488493_104190 [Xylanibacter ruminicola]SHM84630.1 hypothetical protein SAMN04488494_2730 [Xylanibacter ruminicola]